MGYRIHGVSESDTTEATKHARTHHLQIMAILYFISFPCLTVLARPSSMMLSRNGNSRHPVCVCVCVCVCV